MRLTFDTDIAVQPCTHFGFDPPDGRRVLAASTIVEMKYCVELPAVLQELVATFKLVPATISKYRLSLEVLRDAGMRTGLDRRDLRATLAGLTTTSVSPLGRA